ISSYCSELVSEESEIDDPSTCFVTDRHHLSEVWSTTALPVKKRASVRRRGVSNGDLEIVRDVFEKNDDMWASDSGYAKFDKRLRSCTIVRTMRSASLEVGAMTLMTNVIEGYLVLYVDGFQNVRDQSSSLSDICGVYLQDVSGDNRRLSSIMAYGLCPVADKKGISICPSIKKDDKILRRGFSFSYFSFPIFVSGRICCVSADTPQNMCSSGIHSVFSEELCLLCKCAKTGGI
ncbi:hypothetical protein ADUPG1_012406, partial [Aduncisulcus paluster]